MTLRKYQCEYAVDEEDGVAYINLTRRPGPVARTIELSDGDVFLDVDADGELCGIELLRLRWEK